MKITFQPKWKEELIGSYGNYKFSVQMTMGKLHVYFPDETMWEKAPPPWAKGKWEEVKNAARIWAESQGIPFSIDNTTWLDFYE